MKFLMEWWWANENAKEVNDRFKKWKPKGNPKFLYPISTMIGRNRSFCIVETDDLSEVNANVRDWTDICTYDIIPILDSRAAVSG